MAMEEYFTFSKLQNWNFNNRYSLESYPRHSLGDRSYLSVAVQLYCAAPVDNAVSVELVLSMKYLDFTIAK